MTPVRLPPLMTRLLLTICLFAAPFIPSSSAAGSKGETPMAWHQEVRLRKLHLVRPDLIPYPIFYDVYC